MVDEIESLDAPENLPNMLQNPDVFFEGQDQNTTIVTTTLQDISDELENPNRKLSIIDAILDDQTDIEEPKQKLQAIETTLAEQPLQGQEKIAVVAYSDSEKKVEEIKEIIEDRSSHTQAKFASIQAILGGYATDSNNPWLQAHQALNLIEDSSRKLIKSEEKRQKELRESWKKEMEDKAQHHYKTAQSKKYWGYGSQAMTFAAFALPFCGNLFGELGKQSLYLQPILHGYEVKDISSFCKMGADTLKQIGGPAVAKGADLVETYAKKEDTFYEWATQQERQDLDQQGQIVQETRQNDNSLKERHLEVIRTLSAQIVGR